MVDKESDIIVIDTGNTDIESKEKTIKSRSWVYSHAEKLDIKGKTFFYCRSQFKSGKKCNYKIEAKKGNTSTIAHHLNDKHHLKPVKKLGQKTIMDFNMTAKKEKSKSFREAFAEAVVKQYLPFSLIEEKVIQDSYISFLKEHATGIKKEPTFVTDKTVAADVSKMAEQYVAEMSKRFKSKLSLCMDIWTGANKMSFLGITFTFLDDEFKIQRGLLDMVKMKRKHNGIYYAGCENVTPEIFY